MIEDRQAILLVYENRMDTFGVSVVELDVGILVCDWVDLKQCTSIIASENTLVTFV